MTDNGGGRRFPRMIRTHDLVSGEDLLIVFFPKAGVFTINGYLVTRSPGLSGWAGESEFHRDLGNKKYTVATVSLTQLYL